MVFENRELEWTYENWTGSLGLQTEFEHEARSTQYVSLIAPSGATETRSGPLPSVPFRVRKAHRRL